jgi:ribosomal protein S18 acetylase RimI-like enzyme
MAEPSSSLLIEQQDFDSEIFGRPVYRLTIRGGPGALANPDVGEEIAVLARALAREGIGLCSCRVAASDSGGIRALEAAGFRPIERLITLARDLALPTIPATGIHPAEPSDQAACQAIARGAFALDRYHADPFIPKALADRQKEAWVRNGFAGRADRSWVAREAGLTRGFILCRLVAGVAIIDLIAVAAADRRCSHGRRLTAAAIAHYAGRHSAIRVATQESNLGALALYRGLGFSEAVCEVTYHFTPAA